MHDALYANGGRFGETTWPRWRSGLGSMSSASAPSWPTACTRRGWRATPTRARAEGIAGDPGVHRQRPPSHRELRRRLAGGRPHVGSRRAVYPSPAYAARRRAARCCSRPVRHRLRRRRTKPRRDDPVANVPSENGIRESVQTAAAPDRHAVPAARGQDARRAGAVDEGRPRARAGQLGVHFAGRQPDGVRDDRPRRDAGLRADRDLRRADAGRAGRGPVRRPRRRAADPAALPLQAGGDDAGSVRRRLRRRRRVRQGRPVQRAGGDQAATAARRRDRERHVVAQGGPPVPAVGEKAPKVHTDTLETRQGDVSKIDTRQPPSDMHERLRGGRREEARRAAVLDAAAVRVARVRAGDRHRAADESQVRRPHDLHPPGGLRRQRRHQGPARAAQAVQSADRAVAVRGRQDGTITARLEGSIGVGAFEDAVKTGL